MTSFDTEISTLASILVSIVAYMDWVSTSCAKEGASDVIVALLVVVAPSTSVVASVPSLDGIKPLLIKHGQRYVLLELQTTINAWPWLPELAAFLVSAREIWCDEDGDEEDEEETDENGGREGGREETDKNGKVEVALTSLFDKLPLTSVLDCEHCAASEAVFHQFLHRWHGLWQEEAPTISVKELVFVCCSYIVIPNPRVDLETLGRVGSLCCSSALRSIEPYHVVFS